MFGSARSLKGWSVVRTEGPRHVTLVGIALALAVLVGVPLGVMAARMPAVGRVLVGATSVAQTIPALALLCFFVPLGTRPTGEAGCPGE